MITVTSEDIQNALAAVDEEIRRTILAMREARGEDLQTLIERYDSLDGAALRLSQVRASDSWI